MWPDFSQIERVPARALGPGVRLGVAHDLPLYFPPRKFALLDRTVQILLGRFTGAPDDFGCLSVGPVFVTLLRLEVKLHPHALT